MRPGRNSRRIVRPWTVTLLAWPSAIAFSLCPTPQSPPPFRPLLLIDFYVRTVPISDVEGIPAGLLPGVRLGIGGDGALSWVPLSRHDGLGYGGIRVGFHSPVHAVAAGVCALDFVDVSLETVERAKQVLVIGSWFSRMRRLAHNSHQLFDFSNFYKKVQYGLNYQGKSYFPLIITATNNFNPNHSK